MSPTLRLPEEVAAESPFFAVSVVKLAVMSLCTFNLYDVYWFYKQWQRIAERERSLVWPLARALFAVFLPLAIAGIFLPEA